VNAVVDSLGNLSCSSQPSSLTMAPPSASSVSSPPLSLQLQNNDALPEGWEERRTTSGRRYFVNHVYKTTHWERPTRPANEIIANGVAIGATGNLISQFPIVLQKRACMRT
jgi:hypothetical protein